MFFFNKKYIEKLCKWVRKFEKSQKKSSDNVFSGTGAKNGGIAMYTYTYMYMKLTVG